MSTHSDSTPGCPGPHFLLFLPLFPTNHKKNLEILPRRNTRKGIGTKGRPDFWVWIFSKKKILKRVFKVLSTGEISVPGLWVYDDYFLFVPRILNHTLFIFHKSSDFPEVDFGPLSCQLRKIYGSRVELFCPEKGPRFFETGSQQQETSLCDVLDITNTLAFKTLDYDGQVRQVLPWPSTGNLYSTWFDRLSCKWPPSARILYPPSSWSWESRGEVWTTSFYPVPSVTTLHELKLSWNRSCLHPHCVVRLRVLNWFHTRQNGKCETLLDKLVTFCTNGSLSSVPSGQSRPIKTQQDNTVRSRTPFVWKGTRGQKGPDNRNSVNRTKDQFLLLKGREI